MIQRLQSIYLAVTAILMVLPIVLVSSLVSIQTETGAYHLTPESIVFKNAGAVEKIMDSYPIAGAFVISLFLSIYAISQFKNRKFQIKLVRLATVLQLVIPALVFVYANKMSALTENGIISYNPILVLPLIAFVLYILAARSIKKDDALVRSADRLR
ncbi:MAG: DUF4293 domain-containing protein [Flavobacteriales bacterium]|nr:DUF4293 domain-containing protein [Flavobacteriales bacterium]